MNSVLIGYSGFVGSNLLEQTSFEHRYNSKNFQDMAGKSFDRIVCAGLPAAKWIANKDPKADYENILRLQSVLETVETKECILISTIDIYPGQGGLDEDAAFPKLSEMNAYGYHRLQFECFIQQKFKNSLVVRLPGLFGKGLRKNIIFDLLHDNGLQSINPDSVFQWYGLDNLWRDIELARTAGIDAINLFPEPIATSRILKELFPEKHVGGNASMQAHYDMKTKYSALFNSPVQGYIAAADTVFNQIRSYVAGSL
jgi:hypothetical protein